MNYSSDEESRGDRRQVVINNDRDGSGRAEEESPDEDQQVIAEALAVEEASIEEARKAHEQKQGRVIYLGNLPPKIDEESLRSFVGSIAAPVSVTLKRGGFAFVEFNQVEDALLAVKKLHLNPHEGRTLSCAQARTQQFFLENKSRNVPSNIVFVLGYPTRTETKDLEEYFSTYGKIDHVDRKINFCFVYFRTKTEAARAIIDKQRRQLHGCSLTVEFASPDKPQSRSEIMPSVYSRGAWRGGGSWRGSRGRGRGFAGGRGAFGDRGGRGGRGSSWFGRGRGSFSGFGRGGHSSSVHTSADSGGYGFGGRGRGFGGRGRGQDRGLGGLLAGAGRGGAALPAEAIPLLEEILASHYASTDRSSSRGRDDGPGHGSRPGRSSSRSRSRSSRRRNRSRSRSPSSSPSERFTNKRRQRGSRGRSRSPVRNSPSPPNSPGRFSRGTKLRRRSMSRSPSPSPRRHRF